MITICIRPTDDFDWSAIPETYDGKFIDDFCIKCNLIYLEVDPNEIIANFEVIVSYETGYEDGALIRWAIRDVGFIERCLWQGQDIINEQEVCAELDERELA